jgi:uncharacterized repeat protein (TIGR01451 family)
MTGRTDTTPPRFARLTIALLTGTCLVGTLLLALNSKPAVVNADPISPEQDGYPKFNTSVKIVTPTLANTGGATLHYVIEIRNTGSYSASDTTLTDVIPDGTAYDGNAWASIPSSFSFDGGVLTWVGDVGFDSAVVISFSVSVDTDFAGPVRNTAVISHPLISEAVTKTAEAVVTDEPILAIDKTSAPAKPGADKPMTYTLTVVNRGQQAHDLDVTVTDEAPSRTDVRDVGPDGQIDGDVVTWNRSVTLDPGDTTAFTFSVDVADVPSGTVITNDAYKVASPRTGVTSGEPYTVTIVDPILRLTKHVWPDPPGSNREMTYTLDVLNKGSLATDLVITDRVPSGVTYVGGGTEDGGIVSWYVPTLDTGESTRLTYTVSISDVMDVPIVNSDYGVCSDEGVCQPGDVVTSVVEGPIFETSATLDPIAKKPGGGGGPVTPTLVVRNLGPGNALDARATITFERISVSNVDDLQAVPDVGTFSEGSECGDKCRAYVWVGDLEVGDAVTLTTTIDKNGSRGRSTIGGEEGTLVTATVSITDGLTNKVTDAVSDTANCKITHLAHLNPIKTAPSIIGRGQVMTYTISVWNSALATEEPPYPTLWDVLPISGATVLADSISHGGEVQTVTVTSTTGISTPAQAISWTLPAFGTGERIEPRTFAVRVDGDLVSGTKLVNDLYIARWYENDRVTETLSSGEVITLTGWFSNAGPPVTTTVKEVGLIDSYKKVTPSVASPGSDNVLTYTVHVVNSSPVPLRNVMLYDVLPWQASTYQRDAFASAGQVVSDIISIRWTGDVSPFSSEVITLTTLVDEDYQGPLTNTATITHPDLLNEVNVTAVAYVTDEPVLEISKRASRNQVERGRTLRYTIRVVNRGQQATELVITDTLPQNTEYVPGSGGKLVGGEELRWTASTLEPAESRESGFAVTVTQESGREVVNDRYGVTCNEGVTALGEPVVTKITGRGRVYLPLVLKQQG